MTGTGIYTALGHGSPGIALFGNDGCYEYHRANLCLLAGGYWYAPAPAGVWCLSLTYDRSYSGYSVGFRAAYV